MSDHGFTRCDGEFEVIGEDLNMSTMGIVQMTLAELWKAPDISRELALLDAHYQNSMKNKEDKQMLAIGTKVIVRTCNDYNGRYTGRCHLGRHQESRQQGRRLLVRGKQCHAL